MSVMIDKLPGIDTVVAAVVNRLSGPDFARALADVQNARGDGLDLPLPSKIIDAEVDPKTFQAGDFPLAMVLGGDASTNTPRDTDASFTVAVLVVWFLNGDDAAILSRQMQRYLLATRLCLRRVQSFFPFLASGPVQLGTMSPDPTRGPVQGLPARFMKAGTFDLRVPVEWD
jgi:hypothetical protein